MTRRRNTSGLEKDEDFLDYKLIDNNESIFEIKFNKMLKFEVF